MDYDSVYDRCLKHDRHATYRRFCIQMVHLDRRLQSTNSCGNLHNLQSTLLNAMYFLPIVFVQVWLREVDVNTSTDHGEASAQL